MSTNAVEQSPADIFVDKAVLTGFALCWLVPILVAIIDIYLGLGMNPEVGGVFKIWAMVWIIPTAFYLALHPVTLPLPQWLTFGHPVTFGGIVPNVCRNPTITLGVDPSHDWPCFPAHLKDRIVHLAGPDGWRYLFQFDSRILACLLLFVLNIGMLAWTIAVARKPHLEESRTLDPCDQSIVDAKFSEVKDLEKQ